MPYKFGRIPLRKRKRLKDGDGSTNANTDLAVVKDFKVIGFTTNPEQRIPRQPNNTITKLRNPKTNIMRQLS